MTILEETYTLSNRVSIPKLGLGTWLIPDDEAARAVREAVDIGYRNIDTAQAYGNERGVGEGVRTCGIPRDQIFLSTKLAAEIKHYSHAVEAIDRSLEKLGLDYIDLMLIHSPQPWRDFRGGDYSKGNREAWRALEEAYAVGKIRSIGVSNFLEADVENVLQTCSVAPQVNQLLVHAGNTPLDLIDYCASKDILVQAYSPIGHGAVLNNQDIAAMAASYGVSVPQLCIRYVFQLGTQALPKTANPDHMRANVEVDFVISDEDMQKLKDLDYKDYGDDAVFPVYSGR